MVLFAPTQKTFFRERTNVRCLTPVFGAANLAQYAVIARMIPRRIEALVRDRSGHMPAVALLGPRQVGKTTLAYTIAEGRKSVYLDLESHLDREKLADAAFYLSGMWTIWWFSTKCSGCRSCSPPCAG